MAKTLGLWNVGGMNLPDWGVSENKYVQALFPSARTVNNPAQMPGATGLTSGARLTTNSTNVPVPNFNTTPVSLNLFSNTPTGDRQSVNNTTSNYGGNQSGQVLGSSTGGGGGGNFPDVPGYSGPSDEEINNAYQGAYSQLNAQEQAMRGQQPLTEAELLRQGESMKSPYDLREQEGAADLGRQESQTRRAEQNAMAQARQLFNELSQYNVSRFGAGTSTGGAAMELLGRSTQGQMGNVTGTAAENIQKIADAGRALKQFVFTAKTDIDKQVRGKLDQAQQWFKDQLGQINANRASLESDKASKRYEALQARSNFVNQMNQAAWQYKADLASWYDKQNTTLSANAKQYEWANTTPTIEKMGTDAVSWAANAPRAGKQTTPTLNTNYGQNEYNGQSMVGRVGNLFQLQDGSVVDQYGRPADEEGRPKLAEGLSY